jgi:uncharacterized protein
MSSGGVWNAAWEARCEQFLAQSGAWGVAHDRLHVLRVVQMARRLAQEESADPDIVLPAAWLHDAVFVPKDSPRRALASRLAAERAAAFLGEAGYSADLIPPIAHAIEAHSFSADIAPRTLEAQVVQDADRLDALGAIGLARTLQVGAALGLPLYHAHEPFPLVRPPDDAVSTVDHFYTKLLHLADTMQTASGRAEAQRRTAFMRAFLAQLADELGVGQGAGDR